MAAEGGLAYTPRRTTSVVQEVRVAKEASRLLEAWREADRAASAAHQAAEHAQEAAEAATRAAEAAMVAAQDAGVSVT